MLESLFNFIPGGSEWIIVIVAAGVLLFGAVITPDGSGVTMWFVSLPMVALYFAGMFVAERRERQTLKT